MREKLLSLIKNASNEEVLIISSILIEISNHGETNKLMPMPLQRLIYQELEK